MSAMTITMVLTSTISQMRPTVAAVAHALRPPTPTPRWAPYPQTTEEITHTHTHTQPLCVHLLMRSLSVLATLAYNRALSLVWARKPEGTGTRHDNQVCPPKDKRTRSGRFRLFALTTVKAGSRRRLSHRGARSQHVQWFKGTRIGEARKPGPSETTTSFAITTASRSGKQSFLNALRRITADIVLGQETMVRGDDVKKYVRGVKKARAKAKVIIGPGIQGPRGGDSCGTAIVCAKAVDVKPPVPEATDEEKYNMSWEAYEVVPGRITAATCNCWGKGELLIVSVYLDTRDGDGSENRAHLLQLAMKIEELGIPFIIGGDFQCSPTNPMINAWVDALDAVIVAPTTATCRSGELSGSTIDFFVVHKSVAPNVLSVELEDQIESNPHRPVRMVLNKAVHKQWEYVAKKPKAFPDERPCGPSRFSAAQWPEPEGPDGYANKKLDEHASLVMANIEEELVQVFDVETSDNHGKSPYRGRASGFRIKKIAADIRNSNGVKETSRAHDMGCLADNLRHLAREIMAKVETSAYWDNGTAWTWVARDTELHRSARQVREALHKQMRHHSWPEKCGSEGDPSSQHTAHTIEAVNHVLKRITTQYWIEYGDANCVAIAEWVTRQERMQYSKKEANERRARYARFIKQAVEMKGGRIMHKLIRPPVENPPAVVWDASTGKNMRTSTDQANANAQRKKWKRIWGGTDKEAKQISNDMPLEVPAYTNAEPYAHNRTTKSEIDDYRCAIRSFKKHTAMSHDNTKPHDFAHLTDEALAAFIDLYRRCEREGKWPEAWRQPCLVCIPKEKEGEFRLIALLNVAYRIWAKEAAREVSKWMANLERDWVAFGPGCAAEDAAYDICLGAEAADDDSTYTVTLISDLEKGFEKVRHEKLVEAAEKYGFPRHILRLALDMYRSARRIKCGDALSLPTFTVQGVLAGCPIAMGALCLAVIQPVDDFLKREPRGCTMMRVYVDDFTTTYEFDKSKYTAQEAANEIAWNTRVLHGNLDKEGLKLAPDKSKIISRDPKLVEEIEARLSDLGYKGIDNLKLLGVDWSSSSSISYLTAAKRIAKAAKAVRNLKSYAVAGANYINIARAHAIGAARYGCTTMGLPPKLLARVRTTIRSATSTHAKGGSATIDMAVQKEKNVDPAYMLTAAPVEKWACRAYAGTTASHVVMEKAWCQAAAKIGDADDPWEHISGPAAAMIATVETVGWNMSNWHTIVMEDGETINLRSCRPALVVARVNEATERRLWHESDAAQEDTQGTGDWKQDVPWWYPIREIINAGGALAKAARSVVVGTQWTQARLYKACARGVETPWCQACDGNNEGTLNHRHSECPEYNALRNEYLSVDNEQRLRRKEGGNLLTDRGILMRRHLAKPPPRPPIAPTWGNKSAPKWFRGTVYVDGSGKMCRWYKELSTAAWAAVIMSDDYANVTAPSRDKVATDNGANDRGETGCTCIHKCSPYHSCVPWCMDFASCNGHCSAKYRKQTAQHKEDGDRQSRVCQTLSGPLAGTEQTVPRAELEAIAQVMENGRLPLIIYTDHRNHMIAFNKGRRFCCDPRGKHVDIWHRIWKRHKEMSAKNGDVQVKWIRSHQKKSSNETMEEALNREGNDAADEVAVEMCNKHTPPMAVLTQVETMRKYVKEVLCMAARIVTAKGEGSVRMDSTPKAEQDRAQTQLCKRVPAHNEKLNKRIVRRKVVHVTSNCHNRIADTNGDPYQGHGVEPDELQKAWEKSIRVVQKERKQDQRLSSAADRINSIRRRVQEREGPASSDTATPTLRKFIHNESTWLRDRQARSFSQAADRHPARGIGKVLPDEANGHSLRTCDTNSGSKWIWCHKCGAHTQTRIRSLAEQCKGTRNIAQKRRLENFCDPYTNRPNGGQPRDMAWTDVDAVRILEECNKLKQAAATAPNGSECNTMHYGQCFGGPSVGLAAVDVDAVDPTDGGSVLDDDDVLAAMQSIA